ncbi:MAG: hypothetical protein EKK54_04320 [Neisseriaceae bacterium]|nr:MAG: hypothetical protein EKK54_04320 [Neisseriaceae bacterium]
MNAIIKKLLLVLLFMLPICAFASSYPYKIGSIFDDIVSLVGSTSLKWQSPMKLMAIQIFSIFFIPETIWIIIKKLLEGDIGRAWTLFFLRMITGGFYFYWITHPEIYFGIVQFFANAGSHASGFTISGTGDFSVKPSDIMNSFGPVSKALSAQTNAINGFRDGLTILFAGFEIIIVLLCLIVMSLMLALTELETYVVCSGGIGISGFAGSSWTMPFFQSFLRFIVAIGIKMMFMCLILGMFGDHLKAFSDGMVQCSTQLNICNMEEFSTRLMVGVVDCIVLTYLTYHIPNLASSLLSGNVSVNYGGLIGAASAIGATAAAPVSTATSAIKAASSVGNAAATIAKGISGLSGRDKTSGNSQNSSTNQNQPDTNNKNSISGGNNNYDSSNSKFASAASGMKSAGSHAKNAFGQMANMAQKTAPKGGSVNSGHGPNIGH